MAENTSDSQQLSAVGSRSSGPSGALRSPAPTPSVPAPAGRVVDTTDLNEQLRMDTNALRSIADKYILEEGRAILRETIPASAAKVDEPILAANVAAVSDRTVGRK